MDSKLFRTAFRDTIPVMTGYLFWASALVGAGHERIYLRGVHAVCGRNHALRGNKHLRRRSDHPGGEMPGTCSTGSL